MVVVLWAVSGLLLAVSLLLMVGNWVIFFQRTRASAIPIVGGLSGMVGLILLPVPGSWKFCWLPLVLDWASLPGILYAIWANMSAANQSTDVRNGGIASPPRIMAADGTWFYQMVWDKQSAKELPGLLDEIHDNYFILEQVHHYAETRLWTMFLGPTKTGPYLKKLVITKVLEWQHNDTEKIGRYTVNIVEVDTERRVIHIDCDILDLMIRVGAGFEIILETPCNQEPPPV